jgi:anaphase-promoting complex subunit 8
MAVDGDLLLARDYLERVAGSNAEEVAQASELLKRVKHMIQERQAEKGKGKMVDSDDDEPTPAGDGLEDVSMNTDQ